MIKYFNVKYDLIGMSFINKEYEFNCSPEVSERMELIMYNLSELRKTTSCKICYHKNLDFLKFKISVTNSISNRLVRGGQFYTSYRLMRMYYISLLRANFLKKCLRKLEMYKLNNYPNNDFIRLYKKQLFTRELDYVLVWRGSHFLSLFDVKSSNAKYDLKDVFATHVIYLPVRKRLLFVWRWLAVFLRCCLGKSPARDSIIFGINNFLFTPPKKNVINDTRIQIYKLKLLQVV